MIADEKEWQFHLEALILTFIYLFFLYQEELIINSEAIRISKQYLRKCIFKAF